MAAISKPRINKDGSVSVTAEIRIKQGGKIVWRESETFRKKSEKEAVRVAERWAGNRETQLAQPGEVDRLVSPKVEDSQTVSDLIDRYIEEVYPLRPWGVSKSNTLKLIQQSEFGSLIASKVVAFDIIRHCREWAAGSSPQTANQHYIYIRGVFSVAEEVLGTFVSYPEVEKAQRTMSKLGIVSKSIQRERRPTIKEMTDIVSLAHEKREAQGARNRKHSNPIPMDKVIVFAMFSGRRQAEITRISRSQTDFERHRVFIPDMKHPTKKKGNDVWCAVPDRAWKVLMSMPDTGSDLWFPHYGRTFGSLFRKLIAEAGHYRTDDKVLKFHDLRHECASHLFELNGLNGQTWDVPRVADVTGHQDWGSLQRYTQIAQTKPYDKWAGWEWSERVLENF